MSHLPPRFGPFEPVQRLGAGGMAETFVAVRRGPAGFEQHVCIKRILPAYEADRDFVDAFLREARTSAQLRHANIVQVLDFGLADDSHYLALELVDGVDLRALLRRHGGCAPLDAELVTLIAGDLALALDHAHGGGQAREAIVHRDISPSNVLASRAGEIKLTDFGIARAIGGTHHTATGIIKGKVPYLPPEYIERGEFEARSDLFSLGVMLHELLTGQRPFDGESDLDTVRRIVSGERRDLRALASGAPEPLLACIEQLLSAHPAERPPSARAVLDALPQIAVHRVRMRLGDLVRQQLGELATGRATRPAPAPPGVEREPTPPTRRAASLEALPPTRTLPLRDGDANDGSDDAERAAWAALTQEEASRAEPERRRGPDRRFVFGGLALAAALALLGAYLASSRPPAEGQRPDAREAIWAELRERAALREPAASTGPTAAASELPAATRAPAATPAASAAEAARTATPAQAAELRIVVIPFGDVWIDGKARGHAPVDVELKPGSHDIAWGDGRPEEQRAIEVTPGQRESIVLRRQVD